MTIKESIIQYLEEKGVPIFGGTLERDVGLMTEHKFSNISRRCRELEDEGKIISRYVANPNGRGNKVVTYMLRPEIQLPPSRKPFVDTMQNSLL